jgi:hypothetical protein
MSVWHDGNRGRVSCSFYKAEEMLRRVNPCELLAADGTRTSSLIAVAAVVIFIGFLLASYTLLLMNNTSGVHRTGCL